MDTTATRKRWTHVVMVGAALTLGLAACGSDSKDPVTTKAPTVTTSASDTPTQTAAPGASTGSGDTTPAASGSSGVDEFCRLVEDFVADAKSAGSDPTKVAALQQRISEISTKLTQELTANPDQAAALQACSQKAVAAYTG